MLSIETEARIADFIKIAARYENHIEIVRQVLAEQPRFEPYALFRRLDYNKNGYLTLNDFYQFLK